MTNQINSQTVLQPETISDQDLQRYYTQFRNSLHKVIEDLGEKFKQDSSPEHKVLYFERIKKLITFEKNYLSQHPSIRERINKILEKVLYQSDIKIINSLIDFFSSSSLTKAERTFNQLLDSSPTKNWTLLHYAAYINDQALVRCLIESGTFLDIQDHNQQTALHVACQKGHTAIAALLIQNQADLSCTDKSSKKPCKLLSKEALHSLLLSLGLSPAKDNTTIPSSAATTDQSSSLFQSNPLELACLLQDRKLAGSIRDKLGDAEFNRLREELKGKYSANSLKILYDFKYDVELKASLVKETEEKKVSYSQEEVEGYLNKLVEMCEAINFSDSSQDDYYDPKKLSDDGKRVSIAKLQKSMKKFVQNVIQRKKLAATQNFTPEEFTSFFDELQRNSVEVVKKLEGMEKKDRTSILIDIAIAGNHCGARYMGVINGLQENLGGYFSDLKDQIQRLHHQLKENILREFCAGNPHLYNRMMELIGEEIGMSQKTSIFDRTSVLTKENCRDWFFQHFTTTFFIDSIYAMVNDSKKITRDLIIDWFKDNVPEDWRKEEFARLQAQIQEMKNSGADRAAIKAFLEERDVLISDLRKATREEALASLKTPEANEVKEMARTYILSALQSSDPLSSLDDLWDDIHTQLCEKLRSEIKDPKKRVQALNEMNQFFGKISQRPCSDAAFDKILDQAINDERKQSYLTDFVYEKSLETGDTSVNISRQAITAMLYQLGQLKEASVSKSGVRTDFETVSRQTSQKQGEELKDSPTTKAHPRSFVRYINDWFSSIRNKISAIIHSA